MDPEFLISVVGYVKKSITKRVAYDSTEMQVRLSSYTDCFVQSVQRHHKVRSTVSNNKLTLVLLSHTTNT